MWLDVAHFEHLAHSSLAIFDRPEQSVDLVDLVDTVDTVDAAGTVGRVDTVASGRVERVEEGVRLAEQALAVYGGPFLPTDPFADWASGVRERTLRLWAALVRRLAAHFATARNLERASLLLGRLVDAMPDNEDAAMRLMLLYAATNQRSLALRVYQALCTQLQTAFGAPPAAALQQLAHEIRTGTLRDDPLSVLGHLP